MILHVNLRLNIKPANCNCVGLYLVWALQSASAKVRCVKSEEYKELLYQV